MTIILSLVRSWTLMKVCRLFALLMKWHNSCWTHSHTHTHAHLPHRNWFNFCFIYYIYLCWYFWFFGWHCSSWGHNKEHILRASRRENRFALLLLLCTAQQLSRWNRSLALDRLKRYICLYAQTYMRMCLVEYSPNSAMSWQFPCCIA